MDFSIAIRYMEARNAYNMISINFAVTSRICSCKLWERKRRYKYCRMNFARKAVETNISDEDELELRILKQQVRQSRFL